MHLEGYCWPMGCLEAACGASLSAIEFSGNHSPFRNVAFAGRKSQMGLHIVYMLHTNAGWRISR